MTLTNPTITAKTTNGVEAPMPNRNEGDDVWETPAGKSDTASRIIDVVSKSEKARPDS